MAASGQMQSEKFDDYAVVGEWPWREQRDRSRVRLSMAMAVREAGLKGIVVPKENASEAAVVEDIEVIPSLR